MVRLGHRLMFCTRTLLKGHHEWAITVYENGKILLNSSQNNDTEIVPKI